MAAQLNQALLQTKTLSSRGRLLPPTIEQLQYPVKMVQFGSGALLRGFIDFFVDQGQRQGIYKGRAVVVNNTRSGRSTLLNEQNGLYTLCTEGFAQGRVQKDYTIIAAIHQALPAVGHWPEILAYARQAEVQVITSNTTEVGIALQEDDPLQASPPASFPGKLTAFLLERYRALGGTAESGLIVLPTELIPDNGSKLRQIVLKLSEINQLDKGFRQWVSQHNIFCNTLVDRIVPGEPDPEKRAQLEDELGYEDALLTVSEVYRLFAIEGDKDTLLPKAPFLQADAGIIIAPDITPYRERKLRILNGGHTISVAAGFLCGLETVYDCMQDEVMAKFIRQVIHHEIVPSLEIDQPMAAAFADDVLDRFRNPFLHHRLISIALQYTSKMNMRNGLTFVRYQQKHGKLPELMCAGFAAYLLFTRPIRKKDDQYFGEFDGETYPLKDDQAPYLYQVWQQTDATSQPAIHQLVTQVLAKAALWEQDLQRLPGFSDRVAALLSSYLQQGVRETLQSLVNRAE